MTEYTYLGHVVGNGVVKPQEDKLTAIKHLPQPTTKKQIQSFLGLTGYYRQFIPNYAAIAVPLTNMIKKSGFIANPDFSRPFILQTDASEFGVGAVLIQVDAEGYDHSVAYFSRKLLPREQRYTTVEKECLAIKLGVQAFQVCLLEREFIIQTDHRALQWLTKFKDSNHRLMRWSLALQPFLFTIQHRREANNTNADTLSRWVQTEEEGRGVTEQGTQGHLMKSPARPEHEHCLLFDFYCNDIVF